MTVFNFIAQKENSSLRINGHQSSTPVKPALENQDVSQQYSRAKQSSVSETVPELNIPSTPQCITPVPLDNSTPEDITHQVVTRNMLRKQSESSKASSCQPDSKQKPQQKRNAQSIKDNIYCKDCHKPFMEHDRDIFKCKSCNYRDFNTLTEPPLSWVVCRLCVKNHQRHKDVTRAYVETLDGGSIRFSDVT